jgi:ubiquinone/menaquinone biosynthesis C-methylase UbiE
MEFQKAYWERESLWKRRSPDHPVVRQYVESRIDVLKTHIDFSAHTNLLDVGCGNGFFTTAFERIIDTTGVDYSQTMLDTNPARKKRLMNAEALRFDDASFDIVFCHALLHHLENASRAISEMKRVARNYVVVLEPNRNNPLMFLFSMVVPEERNALRYSLRYVSKMVRDSGLHVVMKKSFGTMVPNKTPEFALPLASKLEFAHALGMTNIVVAATSISR